jgi:tetratricopeptide (TPR) repeat protein
MNRGEYKTAEAHFRKAIQRLTKRNSNPYDGESHYNLGLCLRYQIAELPVGADSSELFDSAYAALYKSTWNQAWIAPARIALAEMDMSRGAWTRALEHIDCALKYNSDNLHARVMKTITLKRLGRSEDAARLLDDTLSIDPLDNAARWLKAGRPLRDEQAVLDVVFDFSRRGLLGEAASLLRQTLDRQDRRSRISDQNWGARPMLWYALGWIEELMGDSDKSKASFLNAARQSPDYCFPSRLEEIAVLKAAIRNNPDDSFAVYYLGCLLYDRRCYDLAIDLWEKSANLRPGFATVWRNLGIAYFNIRGEKQKALDAYNRAFDTSPQDARVLYERDQLWKRVGESPDKRLHELVSHLDLTTGRDDLSIELCALYNQTGLFETALEILTARQFQPWEGGEGGAISQFTRAHLSLGYKALESGDALIALEHFSAPLAPPHNLSEQRSILANTGNIHYAVGLAYDALGDSDKAISHWRLAAEFVGDFQEMSVQQFSAMTAFSALAWKKLGKADKAEKMLLDLLEYGRALEKTEAKIDYFATSLPTLLLFDDDLQARLTTYALLLQGLAEAGMRHEDEAQRLLALVASRDPNLPIEQLR